MVYHNVFKELRYTIFEDIMSKHSGCSPCADEEHQGVKRFTVYKRKNNGKRQWIPLFVMCERFKHITHDKTKLIVQEVNN